jgi:hypothetical protein
MEQTLPAQAEPRTTIWRSWRRFWLPLTSLASAAAIVVTIIMLVSAGTTRSLADTLHMLTTVRSFHLVDKKRDGPPKPSPLGGVTPDHPDNPFAISQYWFEGDPNNPHHDRMRAATPKQDVWRDNNRVLTVSRTTGERSFQLDNSGFDFGGQGWWDLPGISERARLHEISARKMPGVRPDESEAFWFAEYRDTTHKTIYRLCVNRTNQLPVQIQIWSTGFPQVAAEVLLREWEFSEFNANFPENVFAFEITEQDLVQLGVTRAELDALGEQAMSFQLTGATGAEIIGTLTDDSGTREIKGKLPFAIVQTQQGKLRFDFRMADGRARQFGLRYKNMPAPVFGGTTKRITGWTSTNWAGEIKGEP